MNDTLSTRVRVLRVLVVEDNPADARLIREGLTKWVQPYQLNVCQDGAAALEFLRLHGPEHVPDLVVLDWNLPGVEGREVLRAIKSDDALRAATVLVFSSSENPIDRITAQSLQADAFITKPLDLEGFLGTVTGFERLFGST